MNKILFAILICTALTLSSTLSKAQNYQTGIGLGFDVGDGANFIGPQVKHFFSPNGAGQADLLFAGRVVNLNLLYQHHWAIKEVPNLQWYLGTGPGFYFYKGGVGVAVKPMVGLDFIIPGTPIDLTIDWRPSIFFGNYNPGLSAGRFGMGVRFLL